MRFLHKKTVNGTKIRFTAVGRHRCRKNFNCILYYHFSRALSTACTAGKIAVFGLFLTRKIGGCICVYMVGRGDSPVRGNVCEADKRVPEFGEFCPRRFRPLREGAVKCTAFDWGRDFSVSLPPSRLTACHLPLRGRGYGAPSRRPLRSHCFCA